MLYVSIALPLPPEAVPVAMEEPEERIEGRSVFNGQSIAADAVSRVVGADDWFSPLELVHR
jgi:hypothetical protein